MDIVGERRLYLLPVYCRRCPDTERQHKFGKRHCQTAEQNLNRSGFSRTSGSVAMSLSLPIEAQSGTLKAVLNGKDVLARRNHGHIAIAFLVV